MEVLEVEPDIQDAPNAKEISQIEGEIEFHNVSFKYKENHDHVLKKHL